MDGWTCRVWRDRSRLWCCCSMQCIRHGQLQRTKLCGVGKVWCCSIDPSMRTKQFAREVELGNNDDATNTAMLHIQESNNVSTHFLSRIGYNGEVFKNTIKKVNRKSVTVRHSMERIAKIQKATTQGNLFHATGGGHLTDDDIFWLLKRRLLKHKYRKCKRRRRLQERCWMLRGRREKF